MFGFIGNIGPWELIMILLVALIVVGPGKLPEVAKSVGKATREFKKATGKINKEINEVVNFDFESDNQKATSSKNEDLINIVKNNKKDSGEVTEQAEEISNKQSDVPEIEASEISDKEKAEKENN